jgi:hypothetical protein
MSPSLTSVGVEAPTDDVVATDLASVDADCDNGTTLHRTRGSWRGDG